MEGKVKDRWPWICSSIVLGILVLGIHSARVCAQESAPRDAAQLKLRRSVNTREYQGKSIEGEERVIGRGDSLWRILVQEKGLPENRFRTYLVVIHGLNPQLKNSDVLRLGDSIFIPLRPDEAPRGEALTKSSEEPGKVTGKGVTASYRVKAGEYLYQILRDHLGLSDNRKVATYAALVKDLNPERQSWDRLQEGDVIRLPTVGQTQAAATKPAIGSNRAAEETPAPEPVIVKDTLPAATNARDPVRLPAKGNLPLLAKVMESLGSQLQSTGEEVVTVKDTTVRIDKSSYPVIYSPRLHRRVVLDPENKIPAALRSKLSDPRIATPVVAMTDQVSLEQAVSQLLAGLGYQSLPVDRPVVIQDQGISFEAQGHWMVLAPEENNKPQEVYVINLTDGQDDIPGYLKSQLARKGLHLRDVLLPSLAPTLAVASQPIHKEPVLTLTAWHRDKSEIVDSLLLACQIPFGVAQTLSVEMGDGLQLDARADRVFDLSGRRIAVFFNAADPDIKKALQEKQGIETVELELARLSSREMISRFVKVLGDQTTYREHRFPAVSGSNKDRLIIAAWGFLLPKKSVFVTDREIPQPVHRFFFEKGLQIVYFR